MFRIRRIHDDVLRVNRDTLSQVRDLFLRRFPSADPADLDDLAERLRNPFQDRFRTTLYVVEDLHHRLLSFAILRTDPEVGFAFLDYIATEFDGGGGVGSALYARVREEARAFGARALLLECLPDEPPEGTCPEEELAANRARLRFYEAFGARPVVGTDYETPVSPADTCAPHLVFDDLGTGRPLRRRFVRRAVRAILERKYSSLCSPAYVRRVVGSFRDDPVRLREPRHASPGEGQLAASVAPGPVGGEPILLVVSEHHELHHVRERGYVEAPVRIASILSALEPSGLFERVSADEFADHHVLSVHDPSLVRYLETACAEAPEGASRYPYVFPVRNKTRPPREPSALPGYYCIDTFTPIHRGAWAAARHAVDCALTGAAALLDGQRLAYALVRPPGHHAERGSFGGFCYLNNTAIAASYLSAHGPVAILDLDYHHGNGQQDIFYRRSDVVTVSLHGHPSFAYPYFAGFEDERGEGPGEGFNLNLPLPEDLDGREYRRALLRALRFVEESAPTFLVVALGLDPARRDPTGTWSLTARDFEHNGRLVGELGLPTLVVQEGGYRTATLGSCARHFFTGLAAGTRGRARRPSSRTRPLVFRDEARPTDRAVVRDLVSATGYFRAEEVDVAEELMIERLERGAASGYEFVFAEREGRVVAYTCWGPVPGTESSFDLYWIVVEPRFQGRGAGCATLEETERHIRARGGSRVYLETSGRAQYRGTRAFYERCGYRLASVLDDFYAPGDSRCTYLKLL